ncbi:MAG: DUF2232 domain-containing protein [Hyphomicrobiaceae bacterium]|nr:DUF2232 domain-containing protein [Hyphomicrobiaceae bacterium]
MPQAMIVGVAAGIASALLFASAGAGGMGGRLLLFFLAPLPTYLAGLGWGSMAAAVAAVMSAIGAALFLGAKTGAIYLLGHGLPAVVLCHLALLNRASASDAGVEWYPAGRVLAAATLVAAALAFVTIITIGADLETLRQLMREFLDTVILKQVPGLGTGKLTEVELGLLVETMVYALPAGSAFLWLAGFVLNLWLAGRITHLSGRLARPWPDIPAMRFPPRFGLGLIASVGAAVLLSGYPGLLAWGFVGAFFLAYTLMGLAFIHYATRGNPARPFLLWGVYFGLIVLNTWAALIVALLAVLEPVLPWRRPPEGSPPPS